MLRTKDFNSMIEIYVGMEIFRNQTEINDDGVTIPKSWTDAELQSHQDYQSTKDALIADRATMVTTMANEETQKATNKASGNQKLLDLGLTQAEATALTGYTPPVAE
jgi:hypothetical protein